MSSPRGDVNRVKKHRRLGEEDVIRIYKDRLSQRALLAALASIKGTLQCDYSELVRDYKLNVNRYALDSVRDDRTAFDACKRHMRARTTVRFPALQFNAVNKQFVATRKVPQAVVGFSNQTGP